MSRLFVRAIVRLAAPLGPILALFIVGTTSSQYWRYVLSEIITAMLVGTALVMLVGFARCITLASGAVMALGAYCATLLITKLGCPYIPAVLAGTVFGAVGGLALAIPSVRFRGHNLAMVTLVFQSVVIIVLREWKSLTGGAEGMKVPPPNVFGMEISGDLGQLVLTVIGAVIALPLLTMLLLGPFGKNLRSLAGNEIGARAFGISVEEHLIAAFVISSAILAFAAILSAPQSRILDPDSFGLFASIAALAYPIVGGMGSLWGGLIGGAAMRALPELLRPVADYAELVLSAIVLAVILLAPGGLVALCQGMFGQRRRAADDVRTEPIETPLASVAVGRDAVDASPVSALSIHNVSVAYDALRAVDDTSLTVPAGTIYGVMGPNGAGKTTLFNLISGFIAPSSGRIYFFGAPLLAAAAHHRIALGISRTFQHVAIFPQLTCRDNVVIGLGANRIGMVLARSFNAAIAGTTSRRETASAERALEAVGLGHYCAAPAGSLSLGDQRRLEIARAIVSKPRLILLDEPVSGLTNDEVAQIGALLRRINRELGVTILIVEHNIGFLLDVCDQLSVMGQGRVVAEGSPDRVVATPEVRRIYFGESRVE